MDSREIFVPPFLEKQRYQDFLSFFRLSIFLYEMSGNGVRGLREGWRCQQCGRATEVKVHHCAFAVRSETTTWTT